MIDFDHELVARAVLKEMIANPKYRMVTLEWNMEDVIDVYASRLRDKKPYRNMDSPNDAYLEPGGNAIYYADRVPKDGKMAGISSGRFHSVFYRKMISSCSMHTEFSALGTEVTVLWENRECAERRSAPPSRGFRT